MTLPDKTGPRRPRKQPPGRPTEVARSTTNGQRPAPRNTSEDVQPSDRPIYRTEPDKKLQHRTLFLTILGLIATLACICVIAIVTGAMPAVLGSAILILALAVLCIVRHVFPGGRTKH